MARSSTSSTVTLRDHCVGIARQEAVLREGGGKAGLERQRKLGRLPARERIVEGTDCLCIVVRHCLLPQSFKPILRHGIIFAAVPYSGDSQLSAAA